jgi:hypothetical protein
MAFSFYIGSFILPEQKLRTIAKSLKEKARPQYRVPFGELGTRLLKETSKEKLSPYDLSRSLVAWTYISIGAQRPPRQSETEEETLRLLQAVCGHRDHLIRHFFQEKGYSHRRVSFFGVPGQVGHSASEVLIDGKWVFLDGMFGLYFARPQEPNVPIGIVEARQSFPNVLVMKVAVPGWKGEWVPMREIVTNLRNETLFKPFKNNMVSHESSNKIVATISDTFFQSKLVVEAEGDWEMDWPQYFNLDTHPAHQIGVIDESAKDLNSVTFDLGKSSGYFPYLYVIGKNYNGVFASADFNFISSQSRSLYLKLFFDRPVTQMAQSKLHFELDQANAMFYSQDPELFKENLATVHWDSPNLATVEFRAHPPAARLQIYFEKTPPPYFAVTLDAIQWKSEVSKDLQRNLPRSSR